MRRIVTCALGCLAMTLPVKITAQAFHFQNYSTTIIKTIAQSPAHDYIEIFNDVNTDTLLRWRADVSSIPASWVITFDDQNNFYPNIQTGDSADFILYDSLQFPQKLIIGAFTNNVAANASVLFEVYNPADTSLKVIIEYLFIITNPVGTVWPADELSEIKIAGDKILFSFAETMYCRIVSLQGKLTDSFVIKSGDYNFEDLNSGIYFLVTNSRERLFAKKFIKK